MLGEVLFLQENRSPIGDWSHPGAANFERLLRLRDSRTENRSGERTA